MRASTALQILVFSFLLTPAHGDFALLPTQEPTETAPSDPAVSAVAKKATPSKADKKDHGAGFKSKPPMALGFGNRIPLSFAVRQIVPHRIEVTFADVVDRDALVDWRGGQEWRSVLRAALQPLGLRLIVRDHAISIVR